MPVVVYMYFTVLQWFNPMSVHYMYVYICVHVCIQVVSQYSSQLAPIAVDAVMRVVDPAKDTNVNLKDIKIIKKLGWVGVRYV